MRSAVLKFGGSSVVDATAIRRVIRLVQAELEGGRSPVVVVSALGGVTDRLLGLAEAARRGHADDVDAGVAQLLERHLSEASQLGADQDSSLVTAVQTHF